MFKWKRYNSICSGHGSHAWIALVSKSTSKTKKHSLRRKNKADVINITERFDSMHSAVILITTVYPVVKTPFQFLYFLAYDILLMMTAESVLSKRPILRFTAALFFLFELFSFHIYCKPLIERIRQFCRIYKKQESCTRKSRMTN